MKYMLMMHCPKNGYESFASWPMKDIQAHIGFMQHFEEQLKKSGELVSAEGLGSPQEAMRVKAGDDGSPVTDGVFAEAKEFLAGFWIVDVASPERAYKLAAQVSAAPGPGGKPFNMWLEVRGVACAPPKDVQQAAG